MSEPTEPTDVDDLDTDDVDGEEEPDEVEAASTRKRKAKPVSNQYRHADGHALIDGARWHYPKTGEPSVCAIKGCDRVLTRHLKKDVVEELEAQPVDEAAADTATDARQGKAS